MHRHGKPGNIRKFKKSWESSKILKNLYGCRIVLVLCSCEMFYILAFALQFFVFVFFKFAIFTI